MLMLSERELIAEYGRKMSSAGLCPGTSGNLSVYDARSGLMAVSPSGIDYFETRPEDVVVMELDGKIAEGERKPSSEWGLHAGFYRAKPDVGAVVHTHSVYCTVFAVLGREIGPVHYAMLASGVERVPCAPYRTFGTPELAEEAVRVCGEGRAVLLENHGIVLCGADLPGAFALALNAEYVAELQYKALAIGSPRVLGAEELKAAAARFETYGQPGGRRGY